MFVHIDLKLPVIVADMTVVIVIAFLRQIGYAMAEWEMGT